jgi:preprotein translocase subunit SecF
MPSFAAFGNDLYSGKRSIDFIGRRKTWYLIAAVMISIAILGLGVRHLSLGIEFRGGSEFRISGLAQRDLSKAAPAVSSVKAGTKVQLSLIGTNAVRVQTDQLTPAESTKVTEALAKAYGVKETTITSSYVGASWGSDVTKKAGTSLIVFLIAVMILIGGYFRTWKMAVAGLAALLHDLLLTAGIYALVGFEVTPASVIGFLTILGYSLYDTVVVFDKVRENTEHITATTKRTFAEAANLAVNQTLVRSINTSIVALLPVGSILFIGAFVLGAGTLKDISLALFVGIAVGTYSSIFIATPLVVQLREMEPEIAAQADRVNRKRSEATGSDAGLDGGALVASASGAAAGVELRSPTGGQRPQPRRNVKARGTKR